MTNEDGPLFIRDPEGANKHRIIVALHLFVYLVGDRQEAANYLGVTRRTIGHAFEGKAVGMKLSRIQACAREYAEEWREDASTYRWKSIQKMVGLIDPKASINRKKTKGQFPALVEEHLRQSMDFALSNTLWHFVRAGIPKAHIRKTIRRVLVKYPELAVRDIADNVAIKHDAIDKLMVKARSPQGQADLLTIASKADKPFIKGKTGHKKIKAPPEVKAAKPIRPDTPPVVKKDPAKKKSATTKAPVTKKPPPVIEAVRETLKPIVEDAEPTVFERIAMQREAGITNPKVDARLAKLLGNVQ